MEGSDMNWRKSSYSSNGGGNCVEVGNDDRVFVRDTADRSGPILSFTTQAWAKFTSSLRLQANRTAPAL
jgi:Domain of unknown function (DUF397)